MKNFYIASALIAGMSVGSASAATLFDETFEDDLAAAGGGFVLNFNSFDQFSVADGTVDLINTGAFGITCATGGACVDLDGSTSDSGIMSSITLNFQAGVDYTFSAVLSGNQRNGSTETGSYGITGGILDLSYSLTDDAFQTLSTTFSVGADTSGSVFFENDGGDNFGAILDRVTVTSDMAAVPLPATVFMMLGALAGMLGLRRRRRA